MLRVYLVKPLCRFLLIILLKRKKKKTYFYKFDDKYDDDNCDHPILYKTFYIQEHP